MTAQTCLHYYKQASVELHVGPLINALPLRAYVHFYLRSVHSCARSIIARALDNQQADVSPSQAL